MNGSRESGEARSAKVTERIRILYNEILTDEIDTHFPATLQMLLRGWRGDSLINSA